MLTVLGVFNVVRMALPSIIKDILNTKIAKLVGYSGTIKDLKLDLYRTVYIIENSTLHQEEIEDKSTLKILTYR